MEPARRYADSNKRRARKYWFPDASGEQKFVCKDMFISTLGYRFDKFISTALSTTSNFGVTLQDKRGKHPPKHAMSDSGKQTAIQHVMSFNPQISHYRREHAPNRLYLPSELTIQEMYEDYLDQRKENNENAMSYVQYTRIVKSQNISFAKLGDEECEMCESHKLHLRDVKQKDTSTSDDRLKTRIFNAKRIDKDKDMSCGKGNCLACAVWLDHQTKYRQARKAYKDDGAAAKIFKDTLFLSSDMQKVILLPRLPGFKLNLFTKRLVVINQTFAPLKSEDFEVCKPVGVLWHEGIAG
eukprot:TCONS_00063646-protein